MGYCSRFVSEMQGDFGEQLGKVASFETHSMDLVPNLSISVYVNLPLLAVAHEGQKQHLENPCWKNLNSSTVAEISQQRKHSNSQG